MSEVAKITLGGQEFDIPQLPLGVMKKVWPITARMARRAALQKQQQINGDVIFDASEENIEDAIELTFIGIAYGKPGFKKEDLESLQADLPEIIAASMVVAIQAGGKRLGEQMAALKQAMVPPPVTISPLPTGTESSPTSASAPAGNGTE